VHKLPWLILAPLFLVSCSGGLPDSLGGNSDCPIRATELKQRLDTELAVVEQSQWWDYPAAMHSETSRNTSLALATSELPYVRSNTFLLLELDGTQVLSAGVPIAGLDHVRFEELLIASLTEKRDQELAMARRKGETGTTPVVALFVHGEAPAARVFQVLEVVAAAELLRVDLVFRQATPPAVERAAVPERIAADIEAYEVKFRGNPLSVTQDESPKGIVFAGCPVDWSGVGGAAPEDKHKVWAEAAAAGFELCRCKPVEDEILWYVQQEKIPDTFTTVLPVRAATGTPPAESHPTTLQDAGSGETWQAYADRVAMTWSHLDGQGWPGDLILAPAEGVKDQHSWAAIRQE
jgi:hypothetical protein